MSAENRSEISQEIPEGMVSCENGLYTLPDRLVLKNSKLTPRYRLYCEERKAMQEGIIPYIRWLSKHLSESRFF